MKSLAVVKNRQIHIDLPDGVYDMDIRPKGDSKTYEQVKKLWATIDDISRAEYGDTRMAVHIYLLVLRMAGVRTDKVLIPEAAAPDLKRKARAMEIVSRETIDHTPYVVANVCFAGISEMNKKEVAAVIDSAIRWASELGIETELETL